MNLKQLNLYFGSRMQIFVVLNSVLKLNSAISALVFLEPLNNI